MDATCFIMKQNINPRDHIITKAKEDIFETNGIIGLSKINEQQKSCYSFLPGPGYDVVSGAYAVTNLPARYKSGLVSMYYLEQLIRAAMTPETNRIHLKLSKGVSFLGCLCFCCL